MEIEYQGKRYTKRNAKWVDQSGATVPVSLQRVLDKLVAPPIEQMGFEEAIEAGDRYKESESYHLALQCFERALTLADTRWQASFILPRVTSCYRRFGRADRVIAILADAENKYGREILNAALLTSAAAACCDLGDPEKALRYCNRAYAMEKEKGRSASGELSNVYERVKRMLA